MANRQLKALRRHRVPAWWHDAKLGIFVHWTPASVPAFAPVDVDIGELVQSGRARRARVLAVHRVVRELAAVPRQPGRAPPPRDVRRPAVHRVRGRLGGRARAVGPGGVGDDGSPRPARAYVVLVTKHMDGYCLWPTRRHEPAPAGLELSRATSSASWRGRARRGDALRRLLLGRARLDVQRPADRARWPRCSRRCPRGDYPGLRRGAGAGADRRGTGRACCGTTSRGRPRASSSGRCSSTTTSRSPTASSTTGGCRGARCSRATRSTARPAGDRLRRAQRQAQARRGRHPAAAAALRRPHAGVRHVRRRAAQAVGVRAGHGPELRVQRGARGPSTSSPRDELLWMLTDIAAKGGNLLLNVGPRGVDAQIPDEQLTRLEWLAEWVGRRMPAAIVGHPAVGGARHDDPRRARRSATPPAATLVYAFVQGATGAVTLPDVRATPTTTSHRDRRGAGAVAGAEPGPRSTVDVPTRELGPTVSCCGRCTRPLRPADIARPTAPPAGMMAYRGPDGPAGRVVTMSPLRRWLERLLGHGEGMEPDPDDDRRGGLRPVPTTRCGHDRARAAGIQASAADEREQGGEGPVTHSRIFVRYADVGVARRKSSTTSPPPAELARSGRGRRVRRWRGS